MRAPCRSRPIAGLAAEEKNGLVRGTGDFLGDALSISAQSAILMLIVIALTVIQFRFIERKVNY